VRPVHLVDDPAELEREIVRLNGEGVGARMMAGFCWPWSDPNADGTLIDDVTIGDFRRLPAAVECETDARKLAPGIPPAQFWATDPGGEHQVGCIYTAQGFEFAQAGVIWGPDLVVRNGMWVGQPSASRDHVVKTRSGARFTDVVKNAYRVLLTRGMLGSTICILDAETRAYVSERISRS